MSQPIGRRIFLGGMAAGAGAVLLGDGAPTALRSWLEGPLGELSPSDGFHFYSVTGSIPRWQASSWRLAVDGLVDRPLALGIEDLRATGLVPVTADFHCVSGWSVAGVRWEGVSIAALLEQASIRPEARALRFESADGVYVDFLDIAIARTSGVIVAINLGDAPLTAERGAPARLVIPFYYGYKGVKWLRRITALEKSGTGYWEARGYDSNASIRH